MLTPLKPAEEFTPFFVVTDIETIVGGDKDGEVFLIDVCWRDEEEGTLEHETFDSWIGWYEWIVMMGEKDRRFCTVYAHNGGGFDWLSLCEGLLRRRGLVRDNVRIIRRGVGGKQLNNLFKV